jgi:hypothetical protein
MTNFTPMSSFILVGLFALSCSNQGYATTPNNPEALAFTGCELNLEASFEGNSFAAPTTFHIGTSTLVVQKRLGGGGSRGAFEGTFDGIPVIAKAGASHSELMKMTYLGEHVPGVSPNIYGHFRDASGNQVIIEERMQPLVYNSGHVVEFLGHLQRIHNEHLYHADIHPENLMANSENSGRFIDFGDGDAVRAFFSGNGFSAESGDVVALGRTLLQKKYATDIDEAARADLHSLQSAPEAGQMFSVDGIAASWIRRSPEGELSLHDFRQIRSSLEKLKIAEEIFARERVNYPELKDITDLNTPDWDHPLSKRFDEAAKGLPSSTAAGFLNEFKVMILKKKGKLNPDDEVLFDMAVGKYRNAKSALGGFGEQ